MKVLKITVLTRFHFIVSAKSSRLVVCHEMCTSGCGLEVRLSY